MTDWALAGARERGLTARLLPTLLLSPSSFRGRESAPDEPLAAAGVGAGAKIAVAERFRTNRAPDARVVASPRSHSLSDDDGVDGESESDRERSPVPAAPPPPPPTTPAGPLDAVVAALAALEAEAEPLTSRSARDRSPWPADAKKMATRVSEMATQALLKLDSIEPPDGDAAFRAARKAAIVRANALGDAMDALKARLP